MEYGGKTDKYEWTQTNDELTVLVKVAPALKARDLLVKIERKRLEMAVKGQDPIISGTFPGTIKVAESTWTKEGDIVEITLAKESKKEEDWWDCLIEEDKSKEGGSIDASLIEASKYLDESLLRKVKEKKEEDKKKANNSA